MLGLLDKKKNIASVILGGAPASPDVAIDDGAGIDAAVNDLIAGVKDGDAAKVKAALTNAVQMLIDKAEMIEDEMEG